MPLIHKLCWLPLIVAFFQCHAHGVRDPRLIKTPVGDRVQYFFVLPNASQKFEINHYQYDLFSSLKAHAGEFLDIESLVAKIQPDGQLNSRYRRIRVRTALKSAARALAGLDPDREYIQRGRGWVRWLAIPLNVPTVYFPADATDPVLTLERNQIRLMNRDWVALSPSRARAMRALMTAPESRLTLTEFVDAGWEQSQDDPEMKRNNAIALVSQIRQAVVRSEPTFGILRWNETWVWLSRPEPGSPSPAPAPAPSCDTRLSSASVEELIEALKAKGVEVYIKQ